MVGSEEWKKPICRVEQGSEVENKGKEARPSGRAPSRLMESRSEFSNVRS